MKHVGNIIKTIRKSKKIPLKSYDSHVISSSFISKFEKGNTDISFSKFYYLIKKLNLTLEEFEYILNDYNKNDYDKLLESIMRAYKNKNTDLLKGIALKEYEKYKEKNLYNSYLNYIMIKLILSDVDNSFPVTKKENNDFIDYLFTMEDWYFYELTLFGNSLHTFNVETVLLFSREISFKTQKFSKNQKYKHELIKLFQNIIIYFIEKKDFKYVLYYLNHTEDMLTDTLFYFEKVKQLFLYGIYDIFTNNLESGKESSLKAISLMRELKDESLAMAHELYLNKKLNEITNSKKNHLY